MAIAGIRRRLKRSRQAGGRSALELAEEAISLTRQAPVRVLVAFYIGALPFVLGLLYYWAEMSYGATAHRHAAGGGLVLALLFGWMKTWQTVYATGLHAWLLGEEPQPWSMGRLWRIARQQVPMQALGLVLLPVSLVLAVPLGYHYAYMQSYTLLGDGDDDRDKDERPASLAKEQAVLWPWQNHILIWLLSPLLFILATVFFVSLVPILAEIHEGLSAFLMATYGVIMTLILIFCSPGSAVVALNLGIVLIVAPQLLKMLLGVESVLTLQSMGMLNSTFFAIVCAATYLCLDPVVKAAYVLRCFYGRSRRTGADLRVVLRQCRPPTVVIAVLVCLMTLGSLRAEVPVDELDRGIEDVINRREFTWRAPRDVAQMLEDDENSWIEQLLVDTAEALDDMARAVGRWLGDIMDWIGERFERDAPAPGKSPSFNWGFGSGMSVLKALLYLLIAALLVAILWFGWKLWRQRRRREVIELEVAEAPPELDLEDEEVQASALPEDEWLALARDLRASGDLRLALRAMFLASLAHLAEQELIRIERYKSNRDYQRELERRSHVAPAVPPAFTVLVGTFERVWYGMHAPQAEAVDQFEDNVERIRHYVAT